MPGYHNIRVNTATKNFNTHFEASSMTKQSVSYTTCTCPHMNIHTRRTLLIMIWPYWIIHVSRHIIGSWGITELPGERPSSVGCTLGTLL